MSGQCTGWVLREGPRPSDVDRTGRAYGQRARGYRAVLVTIADAANRDGEHAHPGQQAMVDGSLYGRAQVLAIVSELAAEGWISIEAKGGGRGKATVYRVEMDRRERVRSVDGSEDDNRPVPDPEPSDGGDETVRSATDTARSRCSDQREPDANGLFNGNPSNGRSPNGAADAAPVTAQTLVAGFIDYCDAHKRPRPANIGMAARNVKALLDAGHAPAAIKHAMIEAPTLTVPAMEMAIAKVGNGHRETRFGPFYREEPGARDLPDEVINL